MISSAFKVVSPLHLSAFGLNIKFKKVFNGFEKLRAQLPILPGANTYRWGYLYEALRYRNDLFELGLTEV